MVLPPWRIACEGTAPARGRKVYDFAPDTLEPDRDGPLAIDRPHGGFPRTSIQLTDALAHAQPAIAACWKWAAARGQRPTSVDLAFTATPFGHATDVAVTGGAAELVACLREVVRPELVELSPRTTRMSARLDFTLADQPAWPVPPARPVASAPVPRAMRVCMPVLVGSLDRVEAPVPFTITDADDRRESVPVVHVGCASPPPEGGSGGKWSVRQAIRSNRRAYSRCYADAHDRDPALTGTVTIAVLFGTGGLVEHVEVTGAGDSVLHACMATATEQIWIEPGDRAIQATYPFTLAPGDTTPPPDVLAALAGELAHPVSPAAACKTRIDILRELMIHAPWPDDPRVTAALRELGTFTRGLRRSTARACLADDWLWTFADVRGATARWSNVERHDALLPLLQLAGGHADELVKLRAFRALELLQDPARRDEAKAELEDLSHGDDPTYAHIAQRLLDEATPASTPLAEPGC